MPRIESFPKLRCLSTSIFYLPLILLVGTASASAQGWAWKEGRTDFVLLHEGKTEAAIAKLEERLRKLPDHVEIHFCLAIAHARAGKTEKAFEHARRAVALGLPPERFLAGPSRLLDPLVDLPGFREELLARADVLVHGPMVGSMTARSARFWLRLARPVATAIDIRPHRDAPGEFRRVPALHPPRADREMTQTIDVDDLEPDTEYEYHVVVGGQRRSPAHRIRTFPATGKPARFTVAFGGGSAYFQPYEFMFRRIGAHRPLAFLQLGDNVYVDEPTRPDVQRYCYYRRQSSPPYRELVASTNIAAIWDDHDFGDDDCHGGPYIEFPLWKRPTWEVFRANWANPAFGGGRSQPGTYFDFSIGDVDFFLLDCRYYREKPHENGRSSMLGAVQKEWLLRRLAASRATFKILATSVPFAHGVKPGSRDPWDGFPVEREEIFSSIERERVEGVVLISADRHRSDAWKIERPDGYDLYELQSSRITNLHRHPVMEASLFGFNEDRSYGLLEFDTTKPDPEVTYKIRDSRGESVGSLTLKRSQLEF